MLGAVLGGSEKSEVLFWEDLLLIVLFERSTMSIGVLH